jgi:hypothetical protein
MIHRPRIQIDPKVRSAFDEIYRHFLREGYDHVQALKKTRNVILDIAEDSAKQRTNTAETFAQKMFQGFMNIGELVNLDNQLNAIIIEQL